MLHDDNTNTNTEPAAHAPESSAPAPAPVSADTAKPRTTSGVNVSTGIVTVNGVDFDANKLPDAVRLTLMLGGLRVSLTRSEDPSKTFTDLLSGEVKTRGVPVPKAPNPWKVAFGHQMADETAKEQGVKKTAPEFAAILAESLAKAHAAERTHIAQAKKHAGVVAHYQRLTGGNGSAASIVAAPSPAPAPAPAE